MTRTYVCPAVIFVCLALSACGSSETEPPPNGTATLEGNAAGNVVANGSAADPATLGTNVEPGPAPPLGPAPEPAEAPPPAPSPPNSQEPEPALEHEYINRNGQRADPPG